MEEKKQRILQSFIDITSKEAVFGVIHEKISLQTQIPLEEITLMFFDAKALILSYFDGINEHFIAEANKIDIGSLKIRDRIKTLLKLRFEVLSQNYNCVQNISKYLTYPANIAFGCKLNFQISSLIWSLALDESKNFSYHSRRAILGVIYVRCLKGFLSNRESVNYFVESSVDCFMKVIATKTKVSKFTSDFVQNIIYRGSC